jgi:CRISPR-associated protein Csb1
MPAGGPEDKVIAAARSTISPSSSTPGRSRTISSPLEGGRYAFEERRIGEDKTTRCVLLDAVQSQANRIEQALLDAHDAGDIRLPLVTVDFSDSLPHVGRITSLDAPHRIADAILRESFLDGRPFRETDEGRAFTDARERSATSLFGLCPTALVLGMWDSTGPKGGLGAKFARVLASEIVGFDAVAGVRTASRVDPLPIAASVQIFETEDGGWTLDENQAIQEKGKPKLYQRRGSQERGRPSVLNLGNITPHVERADRTGELIGGGVTITHAEQIAVVSLAGLRRLRFPLPGNGARPRGEVDAAARTALAALALAGLVLQYESGYDLRSRCVLVPQQQLGFEMVEAGLPQANARFTLDRAATCALLNDAMAAAKAAGLPWREEEVALRPNENLVQLVRLSEAAAPLPEEIS